MSQFFINEVGGTPPPPIPLQTLTSLTDLVVVSPNVSDTIFIGAALVSARSQPFITVGLSGPNTLDLQIQITTASATSILNNAGLASFNSANFIVDSFGFVSLNGATVGQTITGNTGGALSPTAGNWNIFGAAVAAGATPVATSGSGSTLTVNVQRSQAIAASNPASVGLAAFNSSQFSVDSNAYVSLGASVATTYTANSGSAVPAANNLNVLATVAAAGTTPFTSTGAGSTITYTVQRTQAAGATAANIAGIASFNSAQFSVDANGYVTSLGAGFVWIDQGSSITLVKNTGYFVTAATTQTLPASPSQGDVVKVVADTAGAVAVTANTGQTIRIGNLTSSVAGSMTSTLQGDSVELVFRAATNTWISISTTGVWVAA